MKFYLTLIFAAFYFVAVAQSEDAARRRNFNTDNDLALKGFDPISYFKGSPVKGNMKIGHDYKGITYYFANEDNREEFKKSPAKYEPAYGGWCAYTVASTGERVKVNPTTF